MNAAWPMAACFSGALAVALLPRGAERHARWVALAAAGASLALVLALAFAFRPSAAGWQMELDAPWIPSIGARFSLGIDGLSLPLALLNGIVGVAGVLFSWNESRRPRAFFSLFLALSGAVFGVFAATDLFLFFCFYELAIVPKYFLIAIWGSGRRTFAAMKLVLYTFAGSGLALLGILLIHFAAGARGFGFGELAAASGAGGGFQTWVFALTFLGFAVLAGMWPFHTWAPTGHAAAPVAASMLLAGVVMKLGSYACLRVIGLLPEGARFWAPAIGIIGVVNILYGALAALRQTDFKYVIGYSSVSHMGFVLLGLATLNEAGLTGAMLQMFSHGVLGALLFAVAGGMVYERTRTRELAEYDGLAARMPGVACVFTAGALASAGLPGFSGFVSELMVLLGVWGQEALPRSLLAAGAAGILATFAYMLVKLHEVFFVRRGAAWAGAPYPGLTAAERCGAALLLGSSVLVGLTPAVLMRAIGPAAAALAAGL